MRRNYFPCNELRQTGQPWEKGKRPRGRGFSHKCNPLAHQDLRQAVFARFGPPVEQWVGQDRDLSGAGRWPKLPHTALESW